MSLLHNNSVNVQAVFLLACDLKFIHLSFLVAVLMKDSVQSAFYNKQCEKKDNTLQETENDSVDSACCITFSIQQQHTRKRKRSTEPTPDQPDSAKL